MGEGEGERVRGCQGDRSRAITFIRLTPSTCCGCFLGRGGVQKEDSATLKLAMTECYGFVAPAAPVTTAASADAPAVEADADDGDGTAAAAEE